jgi:ankyrin repeat protein
MDLKEAVLEEYALLEYATLNWCFHVRNTQTLDDNLKTEEIIFKRLMDAYDTNLVFQALIVWICSGAGRYALSSRLYPREHKQLLSGWILRHSEEITGYSLLHVIAHANLDNFLRWSIKSLEPDLIDVRDPQERTPLSHAASQGNTEIIMLLLERNVEVDSRDNCGRTPLSYAARDGHTEAIRLLLERNSEVNSKDGYGRTPLSYAARDGHTEAVRLLLERNSEVDWRDENGRTPLSYATNYGHTNAIQLLLERNSEVDSRDNDGQTPLFKSIYGEDLESYKILLQSGADIYTKDKRGQTVLLCLMSKYAEEPPEIELVKWILAQPNFDINCKANDGSTALSLAASMGYKKMGKLLREHGAV